MKCGWIKIHRRLIEKGYYKKSQYVHLWLHLLLKANHADNEFMWNKEIIMIKEGQLLTGRKELSESTGISETTIERILEVLEKEHQIGQQKTNKFRVITILNWHEYQSSDNKRTTNGQQTDTNKNYKNEKNEKKTSSNIEDEDFRNSPSALFVKYWNRNPSDYEEREAVTLIEEFGMSKVREAFHKAMKQSKFSIAYVMGIFKKEREAAELKQRDLDALKKKADELKEAAEERKNEAINKKKKQKEYWDRFNKIKSKFSKSNQEEISQAINEMNFMRAERLIYNREMELNKNQN